MIYIGWGILLFSVIQLLVSFTNWVSRMYLPVSKSQKDVPFVSILIPARNEEKNILYLLNDLLAFDYPNMEIILYDDASTDNTARIIEQISENIPFVSLIKGKNPEKGWLGKNYACHQLAMAAKGDFFLFLDADVRVKNGLIGKAVAYMQKYQLQLLSVFPKQIMPTISSRLVIPLMNWILLSLLPLPLIRLSPMKSLAAANGQCMLFDAKAYRAVLPHSLFRNNPVEDIAILKAFKEKKRKTATLLGTDEIRCRMYNTLTEGINGFSKNVFQFFGGSIVLTFLFEFITTVGLAWILIFNNSIMAFIYLLNVLLIRIFVSLASKQSVGWNLLLLIPQQVVFIIIVGKAYFSRKHKNIQWKERNIYATS